MSSRDFRAGKKSDDITHRPRLSGAVCSTGINSATLLTTVNEAITLQVHLLLPPLLFIQREHFLKDGTCHILDFVRIREAPNVTVVVIFLLAVGCSNVMHFTVVIHVCSDGVHDAGQVTLGGFLFTDCQYWINNWFHIYTVDSFSPLQLNVH